MTAKESDKDAGQQHDCKRAVKHPAKVFQEVFVITEHLAELNEVAVSQVLEKNAHPVGIPGQVDRLESFAALCLQLPGMLRETVPATEIGCGNHLECR